MHSYAKDHRIIQRLFQKENIISDANVKRIEDFIDEKQCEIDEANFNWTKSSAYDRRTLSTNNYVSVIEHFMGHIVEVVVAVKVCWNKPNKWQEVIRRVDGYEEIMIKNIYFTNMGGYHSVWSNNQRCSYYVWSNEYYNKWYSANWTQYRPYTINLYSADEVNKGKYKYLKWNGEGFLMKILDDYRKNPRTEILNQFGLQEWYGKTINKLLDDKNFIKWIWNNHNDPNIHNINVKEVKSAYKRNYSPSKFFDWSNYSEFEKYGYSYEKFKEYIEADSRRYRTIYADYLNACELLGYNMQDTKTLFPYDLQRMHDLRMQELSAHNIHLEENKKKELSLQIGVIAAKYNTLEFRHNGYAIILARCVSDFLREGEILHHCVGKMGYDKKMADDKSLILFVRKEEEIDKPLVTVEYDQHEKRVLQCYAEHDSKPNAEILSFVDIWKTQYACNQIFI